MGLEDSSVSLSWALLYRLYTYGFQEASTPELDIPTHLGVAASSRPKQLITTTLKKREKEKAGQQYKPSKRDSKPSQNINWKSPTFWPMIDQAVKIGRAHV